MKRSDSEPAGDTRTSAGPAHTPDTGNGHGAAAPRRKRRRVRFSADTAEPDATAPAPRVSLSISPHGVPARRWATAWRGEERLAAVLRGLDFVFRLSQPEDNFRLFGTDMLQCFFDVSNVSAEPVRQRALLYAEQLAHRFRHSVESRVRPHESTGPATQ